VCLRGLELMLQHASGADAADLLGLRDYLAEELRVHAIVCGPVGGEA
jgi:hypothetical protein